jgi:hypothetical protein
MENIYIKSFFEQEALMLNAKVAPANSGLIRSESVETQWSRAN